MFAPTIIQRKICALGDFSVGKTSLIRRFVEGVFDERYLSTIGVWISRKTVNHPERDVNLIIWDLAGGDDYLKTKTNNLRGSSGAIIVCDLTRQSTLEWMNVYARQMEQLNPKSRFLFLGNKGDLDDRIEVSINDLNEIANQFNSEVLITSAKTGENVDKAFLRLTDLLLQQP